MYKHGDDVRQDQLVLQMISLMDNLLKQVNLDFKFTAYKVLAFSKVDGMLEFVADSKTI
jgi:phosphatidylinositol 3-kinase